MFSPITLNLSQLVGDVQLAGVAQGNILIRGASKWNNLATGTAGYGLVSGGAGANPSWQPVVLANGVAGGQTIIGGTGAGDNLTLLSTSNATKGQVRLGTTAAWDETTGSFNVGSLTPLSNVRLYVNTGADAYKGLVVRANSGSQSANLLEVQDSGGTNTLYSITPSGAQSIQVRDSVTGALSNVLTLRHNSTGAVTNSFGGRLLLQAESDSQEDRTIATFDWLWTDATDASRKGTFTLSASDSVTTRAVFQGHADGTVARAGICGGISNSWNLFVSGTQALTLTDAGTTTTPTALLVAHNSSGTPAAGMGVQIALAAGTDSISSRTQFTITSSWVDAVDASRDAQAIFYIADAGSTTREFLRMESDGATALGAIGGTGIIAGTKLVIRTASDSFIGLDVRANSASQSANIFQATNSAGATHLHVTGGGITGCTVRTANTNTSATALTLTHVTSATPAASFGVNMQSYLTSSTGATRQVGMQLMDWANATDASYRSRFRLFVYDVTTSREAMRVESDGLNPLIAFTASTPTAHLFSSGLSQPSTVGTATGTNATAEVAITGGLGGNTNIATTGTGGNGGSITFTCGTGGTATAATTAATGGAGGAMTLTGGPGAATTLVSAGTNTGGVGGAITITSGTGGAASNGATNAGANGGAITISGGTAGIGTTTSGTGGLATFRGGAAAATAGSNGGNVVINGRDGSTTGSGGSGGAVTILGGNAGGDDTVSRTGGSFTFTAGSSKGSGAGGGISLSGGTGGPGTGTSGATGGGFGFSCGAGGSSLSTGSATGGNAGTFVINGITGGTANNATTACTGGVGSQFTVTCGTGGAATASTSGTNTGGAGGGITITAGTGGAANTGVTNNGGAGGAITIIAGTGGIGTTASGSGGSITIRGGAGAAAAGAASGSITVIGGTASTTGSGGAGAGVSITGSAAGGDNTVNQAGGNVSITAGNSIGSSTGGAITLTCGAGGVGTGTAGATGGQLTFNAGLGGDGSVTDGAGGAIVFQTADTLTLTTRLTITANGASQFVGGATPTGNTAVQINTGADGNVGLTILGNSATQTTELIRVRTSASVTLWQVAASGLESTWLRDAGTNNTPTIAQFIHGTSGTAAAGFGSSISLEAFSDSGAQRAQMSLTSSWVVATDGSRTARGIINAHDSTTSRECIRVESSGTAAMIGVLGATAIARYNTTGTTTGFTAGAGTNVTDQSTFTGNTGATAYTIGDIVRALKQYGWLTS